MLKVLVLAALTFVFGLGIGIWFRAPVGSTRDSFKEKMQSLLDGELAEYERLKTLEEKYRKADEILAKVMTLLMLDLGLRIQTSALASQNHVPLSGPPETAIPPQESSATPSAPSAPSPPSTPSSSPPAPSKNYATEKSRHEIRTDAEIEEFLKKATIDHLDETLKSTVNFRNSGNALDFLRGRFSGRARVAPLGENEDWEIELSLQAEMSSTGLTGKSEIKMSKNGKSFSNSSGSGSIREYRELTNGSDGLLVKASPTVYLHLYYFRGMDQLAGQVFRRENEDSLYSSIGFVRLNRLSQ